MVLPRQAMVGVCTCGEPVDASLWLQVRRENDQVIWEPDPAPPRSTVAVSWRFGLVQYLDAVDGASRAMLAMETRADRLARRLRTARDSLDGLTVGATRETRASIGAVRSWGPEALVVELAPFPQYVVPVRDEDSDEEILLRLRTEGTDGPRF